MQSYFFRKKCIFSCTFCSCLALELNAKIFIADGMTEKSNCTTVVALIFRLLFPGGLATSAILSNLDHGKYLVKLISYLNPVLLSVSRSYFVRCWHARTDGSAASTFHNNCDGKGPTVTIIRAGQYIFGAYTDVSWRSKYHKTKLSPGA